MKLRKEVKWFAEQMKEKLKKNDYKDGWRHCTFKYLFNRLRQETDELLLAFVNLNVKTIKQRKLSTENIISECVDIANFAMMIADNHKKISMNEIRTLKDTEAE